MRTPKKRGRLCQIRSPAYSEEPSNTLFLMTERPEDCADGPIVAEAILRLGGVPEMQDAAGGCEPSGPGRAHHGGIVQALRPSEVGENEAVDDRLRSEGGSTSSFGPSD